MFNLSRIGYTRNQKGEMTLNISQEKEHVYSLMRDITSERRTLTDIYYSLKERLDDLHKMEQKGLDNLDLKGYVDLHNKLASSTAIENIEREAKHQVKIIEDEIKPAPVVEAPRFKKEIDEQRNNSKPRPKAANLGLDQMAITIASILKEENQPMSLPDLHEALQARLDVEIDMRNFRNNIMYRVNKTSDKVERASHGFYQYKE